MGAPICLPVQSRGKVWLRNGGGATGKPARCPAPWRFGRPHLTCATMYSMTVAIELPIVRSPTCGALWQKEDPQCMHLVATGTGAWASSERSPSSPGPVGESGGQRPSCSRGGAPGWWRWPSTLTSWKRWRRRSRGSAARRKWPWRTCARMTHPATPFVRLWTHPAPESISLLHRRGKVSTRSLQEVDQNDSDTGQRAEGRSGGTTDSWRLAFPEEVG